jgi:hypothetical protein
MPAISVPATEYRIILLPIHRTVLSFRSFMKKANSSAHGHVWRFFRAGGFDQVRLDSAQDLMALENLDQKLWVALACPVDNVYFDARTLSLIDTDSDRRIRPAELIAAIKWTASLLKNTDELTGAIGEFTLQAINDSSDEGRNLVAAMRSALSALGKNETDAVSIADFESLEKVLSQKPNNGDGVITEDAAGDDATRGVIKEIIAVLGAVVDRSGKPGITAEKVETFFDQAQAYVTWQTESQRDSAARPLGDATEAAGQAIAAVRSKIDDYFARCAIAAFDETSVSLLNAGEKQYEAMGTRPLSLQSAEIAELPLARIAPHRPLPLGKDLNPAWADKIKNFEKNAVRPQLGPRETLTLVEWQGLQASFAPWFSWHARRPATVFDTLGIGRAQELLNGTMRKTLIDCIEKDKAQSTTFASLASLEKLARFRRDLHHLCTNFVNFKDFYARGGNAIFQAGTLYLDQRSCNLCLKINDPNKHALMAAMAGTYLVYCECRRPGKTPLMIVAAYTNGDSENLIVGRNGVFYDRAGDDWDATIIKIIENPISLRQAFWLPYKSLVRMIESQVAKRASTAEAQSTSKLEQAAAATASIDKNKPEPPPKKLDIGIVAALGVAAGALGTFVATLLGYVSGIIKLGPLAILGALLVLLLVISGPSLVLAYIKLRKRNLGPILDAGGWAVNAKARINVPFGTVLTHIAALPPGAQRDLVDPYAEKKSPWPKVIVLALLVYGVYFALNHLGFVNEWTGGRFGLKKGHNEHTAVIEKKSPATPENSP